MILNLYTANHGKPDGIEDYISLITKLFGDRRVEVKVSSALDANAVNLILDEFTNYIENSHLAKFKKIHPDCKIVFVLTEFAERKWGVQSLNHFGGILDSAVIALFDVYLRLKRDDFGRVGLIRWLKLLCYMPILAIQMVSMTSHFVFSKLRGKHLSTPPIARYFKTHHRTIYFHMRYLGLKAHLRYADAVISSHEKIIDGFRRDKGAKGQPLDYLGVLYPEFDKQKVLDQLMLGKKLGIEITGSITKYRQQWIERINYGLTVFGLHNAFSYCTALSFSALVSDKSIRSGFSLHPPQTKTWPYCSPTRIFRAISVDNNVPVLTKHFRQNPVEDVCYVFNGQHSFVELYEIYANRDRLMSFIEPRIERYNEIVIARNDAMAEKLRGLAENNDSNNLSSKG